MLQPGTKQNLIPNTYSKVILQVRTNEEDTPWDPDPKDQKVDAKNYRAGVEQLQRDVLRFLEMIPDIKMDQVRIATNVAFPLASESSERAITEEDLLAENAPALLEKLGIPNDFMQKESQGSRRAEDEEIFKKIACRYLGAHSKVPTKISMDDGLGALGLAIKGTEVGFKAQASGSVLDKEAELLNMREAVAKDAWMKVIWDAVTIPKFGKKFQLENPDIPLKDLKVDRERFLKIPKAPESDSDKYPLFGTTVIKAVIRAADEEAGHQGVEAIKEVLVGEKYSFHDEHGNPFEQQPLVDEHVQGCAECSEVQAIKSKAIGGGGGTLFWIPEELEREVLLYADKKHQGFAAAYDRVKTWADFPDFKQKVFRQKNSQYLI